MGLFATLAKPTAPMKKEAASAGVLDAPFGKFARLQMLTVEDLFAGKKPAMPPEDPAEFITQKRVQAAYTAFGHAPPSPSLETSNPTCSPMITLLGLPIVPIRLTQVRRLIGRAFVGCRPHPLGAMPQTSFISWGMGPMAPRSGRGATPLGEAESLS